jgi:chromosome segregation ATPase
MISWRRREDALLGIRDIRMSGRGDKGRNKELQHLSRQDLLELLVGQLRENDELRATIELRERSIEEKDDLIERLKERLDFKDEKIDGLNGRIGDRDEQISHLKDRLDNKDSLLQKLKHRLDAKDDLISRIAEMGGIDPLAIDLHEARQRSEEANESEG